MYARISCWGSNDISALMTNHIKQLYLAGELSLSQTRKIFYGSGELPFSPQLTHLTLALRQIDDSLAATVMKAMKDGKLPNLRRIELNECTINDCEWPEVPEFSFGDITQRCNILQMPKLLAKLTEVTIYFSRKTDIVIPDRLEKLSVLKLEDIGNHNIGQLKTILRKKRLPNLSELCLHVSIGTHEIKLSPTTARTWFGPNCEIRKTYIGWIRNINARHGDNKSEIEGA